MTQCQYRDLELKGYLSGTLSDLENKRMQLHLNQCEVCNQRVELLIDQLIVIQRTDESLSTFRKSNILKHTRMRIFRRSFLKFAAILMVIFGLTILLNRPTSPETYQVTTKMNHDFNNHQYIIEISKGLKNTENDEFSTYLIDTSYTIQLAHNFEKLKVKLSDELSTLSKGHKITVIINGATSSNPNNSPALLDAPQLFSLIYKTRLKSRPKLMEAVDNSLAYITNTNVSPERLIIFSNNEAISLESSIQKRLQQESLPTTKLSFALN